MKKLPVILAAVGILDAVLVVGILLLALLPERAGAETAARPLPWKKILRIIPKAMENSRFLPPTPA